jgi:hypothetical protein
MGSTRRDHVVDDEDLAAIHLADELARLDAGAADPALAHEGHRQRERRASRLCELHRSEIGGDDDLTAATQRRKAFEQGGECAECLGRKRRSPFEAGRVGVHDDKPIGTRRFQQLGGKASPDRPARMAAVLARVADIGHDRGHARRTPSPKGIEEEEQLNEVLVNRWAGRGEDVDIRLADRADAWTVLAVREAHQVTLDKGLTEPFRDRTCEYLAPRTRDEAGSIHHVRAPSITGPPIVIPSRPRSHPCTDRSRPLEAPAQRGRSVPGRCTLLPPDAEQSESPRSTRLHHRLRPASQASGELLLRAGCSGGHWHGELPPRVTVCRVRRPAPEIGAGRFAGLGNRRTSCIAARRDERCAFGCA